MAEAQDIQEKIPGVLACDVGNTAVHFAYVKGDVVTPVRHIRVGGRGGPGGDHVGRGAQGESGGDAGLVAAMVELWSQMPAPRKVVAASVNPAGLALLESAAMEAIHEAVLVVGRDVPLPIDTKLAGPEKIGVDRLCAAVAAFDRLGVACVVADFGTAVTVDCVDDQGVFLGGAILPGLGMGAAALHAQTAQLPEVEPAAPDWVFGRDTREAIVGGLVFAARGALKELVELYATELGHWPVVILTGGDAALVCPDVNGSGLVQAIVPDLVIRGVAAAYYRTLLK
ncbi:MAG: type III pantothenate kinase [Phycisphaerae bacterium]